MAVPYTYNIKDSAGNVLFQQAKESGSLHPVAGWFKAAEPRPRISAELKSSQGSLGLISIELSNDPLNEKIRGLQRLIVGHADDVELDAAGRILVPPALRRYASLDKHVVLVGQGRKFELWDEGQWQHATAQAITFPADGMPPELSGFTL